MPAHLPPEPQPWLDEPDEARFTYSGFDCIVKRTSHGALTGYVVLPADHPLFGLHYDDEKISAIDTHGGWTWSDDHVPNKRAKAQWVLGFDCSHSSDFIPFMPAAINDVLRRVCPGQSYRTIEYVRFHLVRACDELAKIAKLATHEGQTP